MSLKPPKKSDLGKHWMKPRRDQPKRMQPEYHLIITEGMKTEPAYFGAMKDDGYVSGTATVPRHRFGECKTTRC